MITPQNLTSLNAEEQQQADQAEESNMELSFVVRMEESFSLSILAESQS